MHQSHALSTCGLSDETEDGIANIYFPLVMQKPFLIIYFLPLLLFLSIALMNLVTAVLVDSWAEFLFELDVNLFQVCTSCLVRNSERVKVSTVGRHMKHQSPLGRVPTVSFCLCLGGQPLDMSWIEALGLPFLLRNMRWSMPLKKRSLHASEQKSRSRPLCPTCWRSFRP